MNTVIENTEYTRFMKETTQTIHVDLAATQTTFIKGNNF